MELLKTKLAKLDEEMSQEEDIFEWTEFIEFWKFSLPHYIWACNICVIIPQSAHIHHKARFNTDMLHIISNIKSAQKIFRFKIWFSFEHLE